MKNPFPDRLNTLKKQQKMKKLVLTLALAFSAVLFANAQDAPKKATAFGYTKTGLTEIGCNEDQITKIADLKKAAIEKRKSVDADATMDEAAKKAAVKALLKERNDAMNAVLNDEQKKKVADINAQLKAEAKAAKEAAAATGS